MQNTLAPTSSEVVELLKDAMARGATIILPAGTAPPDTGPSLASTLRLLLGLTRAEGRALAALLENEHVSKEQLHVAMASDGNAVSKIKTVDVVVYRVRRKLAIHGIEIATVHGLGFRLVEEARDKLRKLIAERGVELRPRATPSVDQVDCRKTKPVA